MTLYPKRLRAPSAWTSGRSEAPERPTVLTLAEGAVLRIDRPREAFLYIVSGALWLTLEGDACDQLLTARSARRLTGKGLAIGEALRPCMLAVSARNPRTKVTVRALHAGTEHVDRLAA